MKAAIRYSAGPNGVRPFILPVGTGELIDNANFSRIAEAFIAAEHSTAL